MSNRITKADMEAALAELNRHLEARGSDDRYVLSPFNGKQALNRTSISDSTISDHVIADNTVKEMYWQLYVLNKVLVRSFIK